MRINRASASAVNAYAFCPFQYYLNYVLRMEQSSGKAAVQGNIVHQVFEWIGALARRGKYIPPEWLLERAWEEWSADNAHLGLRRTTSRGESADFRFCREAIEKVLDHPIYNPYKLKVIASEKRFEIDLSGPEWEVTEPDGTKRQFRTTGYIDLIHEVSPDTIEIVDWKTGKRQDWGTMRVKDFYDLMHDIQPRLYHFAATQLYPQYKNVLVTFYWIYDGGPMTLPFTADDILPTIGTIWQFFDTVRRDGTMRRNRTWKCSRFCFQGRTGICDSVWADLHARGQEYVEDRYSDLSVENQKKVTD